MGKLHQPPLKVLLQHKAEIPLYLRRLIKTNSRSLQTQHWWRSPRTRTISRGQLAQFWKATQRPNHPPMSKRTQKPQGEDKAMKSSRLPQRFQIQRQPKVNLQKLPLKSTKMTSSKTILKGKPTPEL